MVTLGSKITSLANLLSLASLKEELKKITDKDVQIPLTIHGEALLTELDKGSEYGLVAVRVVLHRLTDDVRHLRERAVIHLVHSVKHASLDGFQTVGDVGHGTMKDYV